MKMKMAILVGLIVGAFPLQAHAASGDAVVNVKAVTDAGMENGSGFFVDNDLVMTASHVVHKEGLRYIRLFYNDYSYVNAHVVMDDTKNDIALLKLDDAAKDVTALKLMEEAKDGDALTITGYPVEEVKHKPVPGTVFLVKYESVYSESKGKLKECGDELVMTNTIKPGYSGSPVLNAAGHVVGMARAHRPDTEESLAVPLTKLAADLRAYYLGVGV